MYIKFVHYICTNKNKKKQQMQNLTITINGNKAGEVTFFKLQIAKSNFINVINMTWETVQDVIEGEKQGHYTII